MLEEFFAQSPLLQIVVGLVLLAGVVTLLRFLLLLARRAFSCGCALLLVVGSVLLLLSTLNVVEF
jgi:hypothetical protein